MKRAGIFIVLICYSFICPAQSQKLSFNQIGLSLELPADFTILSKQETEQNLQKGAKAITEENNIAMDMSGLTTLFAASKDQFSYVTATIEKFDAKNSGPYHEANQRIKELIYSTFKAKIVDKKIDSSSSVMKIDGMDFDKFEVTIELDSGIFMKSILISRLYKGYDLGISYVYIHQKTKEQMDELINSIRFKSN